MAKKKYHEVKDTAMFVYDGIDHPLPINEDAIDKFKLKKPADLSVDDYFNGICSGNRTILSKAITLIESSLANKQKLAQQVIEKCLPFSGNSIRIAITGVPGVGKSTFIEAIGKFLTGKGNKVAVLAIDPSSSRSKGSILGDKTRMEELATDANAFIRPSPSAGTLGGVARKTWETIILCEASGFNIILIETVGVGQSEIAAHSMVDFFLLLMLAGAGDELQGIKRGIMEMADSIIINKADGTNITKAKVAKQEYENALNLLPKHDSGVAPQVFTCSSIFKTGVYEIWDNIEEYIRITKNNKYFFDKRKYQDKQRFTQTINETILNDFYNNKSVKTELEKLELLICDNKISSFEAAEKLLSKYKSK